MFNHKKALREIEFLSEQEAKIYTWNSMELVVPPTVYPPREDTNLLHDIVADIAPFGAKKLLEIGCGSGAISIAAAKLGWSVDACDINPYAVAATRNNAMRHNVVLQVSESGRGHKMNRCQKSVGITISMMLFFGTCRTSLKAK
tara:strand:- start:254 stop:685 length:432 start_codon:yes stop_codon:yes gene_type:complete